MLANRPFLPTLLFSLYACAGGRADTDAGLVAHWDFDTGRGAVAHDESPNKNHGRIHGATWVTCGSGHALKFDGIDDYVDCGSGPSLDITGPVTLEAWIHPTDWTEAEPGIVGKSFFSYALTNYKQGSIWWYISSGGNNCNTPTKIGNWHHVVGTFDGAVMALYLDGQQVQSKKSQFKAVNRAGHFLIGCVLKSPGAADPATAALPHFKGMIDAIRVYNRALTAREVQSHYKHGAADHDVDTTWFDRIRLTPYPYFDQGRMVVEADCRGLFPLSGDPHVKAQLLRADGNEPIQSHTVDAIGGSGMLEFTFTTSDLAPAEYRIRTTLAGKPKTRAEATVAFRYPAPPVEVVSPETRTVSPIPVVPPPSYEFELAKAGGFNIRIKGDTFPVESSYSFPKGGYNKLHASEKPNPDAEPAWTVKTAKLDEATYRLTTGGKYYTIQRTIHLRPNHVRVKDTIANISGDALGIILSNHVNVKNRPDTGVRRLPNPSVFFSRGKHGLGIVALDDVYLTQHQTYYADGVGGLRTDKFGLDTDADYTLEWAVYPNTTGDYYDFINQVRKDEGLIRTVEGGFTFVDRRDPPSKGFVELRGLKYVSIGCLGKPADDPSVSLEGIEFTEYPKESALLKKTFAETVKRHPQLTTMFHVAHSLYATDKPEELFSDSRVLDSAGNQTMYGGNNPAYYARYFSKQRVDQGYRWYIFYPTMENSFGKAMLKAVDTMLDEIGCTGMFADGFTHGYGGWYTYDCWDGHSVEIDPETKTIKRKIGAVNLLAQDVLVAVARKIQAKGGLVIANSYPGTRTVHRENVIYCLETASGDATCARLHLAPTVIGLGNPGRIKSERDVYTDVLGKLQWGALYFYYGEKNITHKTITDQMYPITVEEIHPGTIKGTRRIITTRSGVYGWPGANSLHFAYRYDARGHSASHAFLTTADSSGPRTEITLAENESAVLKKIPLSLSSPSPVNLLVEQYDKQVIRITLNGKGKASLLVRDGEFLVKPNTAYRVITDTPKNLTAEGSGTLSIPITLEGQQRIRIGPALP